METAPSLNLPTKKKAGYQIYGSVALFCQKGSLYSLDKVMG